MDIEISKNLYLKHLKSVSEYQKKNPEKMRQKNKAHYERIKLDPVKYAHRVAKAREYYHKKIKQQSQPADTIARYDNSETPECNNNV